MDLYAGTIMDVKKYQLVNLYAGTAMDVKKLAMIYETYIGYCNGCKKT
jgi:hypothetical protein